uniref:Letm1 RBD domain-containing protein n=1 Tax=Aureoumbra lagunensis TaxID=44058 RepID=A0A7S3K3L7_9STRA|mmetsp:Transcript_12749/g.19135  ORF Transcript_12749/g.19135 Transcript_12749/m.19135 type:complete len:710 (-) Transcript_12749:311-2440(-)
MISFCIFFSLFPQFVWTLTVQRLYPKNKNSPISCRRILERPSYSSITIETVPSGEDEEDEGRIVQQQLVDPGSRTLRLRDALWARQAVDDLVAAELALKLEQSSSAVDYERLREQLEKLVREVNEGAGEVALTRSDRNALRRRALEDGTELEKRARLAYEEAELLQLQKRESESDHDQDNDLSLSERFATFGKKIVDEAKRRTDALGQLFGAAFRGVDSATNRTNVYVREDGSVDWEGALQGARAATAFSRDLWRRINGIENEDDEMKSLQSSSVDNTTGTNLKNNYQEDDELRVRSTLLLNSETRINSTAMRRTRAMRDKLETSIKQVEQAAEATRAAARVLEEAPPPPQQNTLIKNPVLCIDAGTRAKLRAADAKARSKQAALVLADLDLALELACGALELEIEAYDQPEATWTRRLVAEFALLDAQVMALARDAQYSAGPALLEPELQLLQREIADFCGRVAGGCSIALKRRVWAADLAELEAKLGNARIDLLQAGDIQLRAARNFGTTLGGPTQFLFSGFNSTNIPFRGFPSLLLPGNRLSISGDKGADYQQHANDDWAQALFFLSDSTSPASRFAVALDRLRATAIRGLAFYADGTKLLANDVAFCFSLVGRAFNGETLNPRDVRVLRRTLKDLSTTIPFIIILLIPLTPLGHVVVFGAIQRFFPDFFPSCYTERRQNLVKLYSAAELDRDPLANKRRRWGSRT